MSANNTYEILKACLTGDTLKMQTVSNEFEVLNAVFDNENNALRVNISENGEGIIMQSPDGTKYKLTVDNSGNLVTTAV